MSTGLIHGLPVVLFALAVVIYVRTAKRPEPYRLSEKWTGAPILWAAVDEKIPGGDQHGPAHGAGHSGVNVGGGASGGW